MIANAKPASRPPSLTSAESIVALTDILALPTLQVRGGTDPRVVKRYRQAMAADEVFPPLLVAEVNGALLLVDGFHRLAAMAALCMDSSPVEIHRAASVREARWLAAQANLRHGEPLKARARRVAFNAYVRAMQHRRGARKGGRLKSYREISRDLGGIPHTTIRNWMKRDFPSVAAAIGGQDEYPQRSPGGLPDVDTGTILYREAAEALNRAVAAAQAIFDTGARYRLWERAGELREALEGGPGIEKPDF